VPEFGNVEFSGMELMGAYLSSLSWGLVILLAFTGWGSAVNRVFFPRNRVDWGQRAAWGIALSVVVGGILNLTGTVSQTSVLAWVALGVVLWFLDLLFHRSAVRAARGVLLCQLRKVRLLFAGAIAVAALSLLQYAGSISNSQSGGRLEPTTFNFHDDFHAYLVFPEKMLQTGSLGADPFSFTRIAASLGGGNISCIPLFWPYFQRGICTFWTRDSAFSSALGSWSDCSANKKCR
jgi:hypothetical protein